MSWFSSIWQNILTIISRAGGGGSSSSGGGGGFSSGGGSYGGLSGGDGDTDPGFLAVMVSFIVIGLVAHSIFEKVRKTKTESAAKAIAISSGVGVTILYVALLQSILPDESGRAFASVASFVCGIVASVIAARPENSGRFRLINLNSASQEVSLKKEASLDGVWDKAKIIERAKQVFLQYQSDWMSKNMQSIYTYTTPQYFNHAALMLRAIQQMGRHSDLSNIKIHSAVVTDYHDDADNSKDRVTVKFRAQMRALLVDAASGNTLQQDSSEFTEYWHFARQGDQWVLDGISQATEDKSKLVANLRDFARVNNMYFSPDWGHQLIPTRGQLFQGGFAGADINNHVIGLWTGDLIAQLYTYSPDINQTSPTYYVIGQINLPKSYGGIMVLRREPGLFNRNKIPAGYAKYELEWGEFNERYDVLATDMDKVTSFELLNPAFMAWLYDRNIKVDIEVVDNVVYLYAKVGAGENRYGDMLEILVKSHAELKM